MTSQTDVVVEAIRQLIIDGRLRPGMIGAVEITRPAGATAPLDRVAVPLTAVVRSSQADNGYSLYVVDGEAGQEIAHARPVTLGAAVGNDVAVTDGLRAGERVIVMGATLVHDGEPVRVIP